MGGANPVSLSEYYRGGANVPDISQNNAIPTSGAIRVNNFYNTYGRLSTSHTITVGDRTYTIDKIPYTDAGYATSSFSFGSLSSTTFTSSLGSTTIVDIYWDGHASSIVFILSRDTNTNLNFYEIVIGSDTYVRSAASYTDLGSQGKWVWNNALNSIGFSGTKTLTVRTYA